MRRGRGKIADIKRSEGTTPLEPKRRHIPAKKEVVLDTETVLDKVYPNLDVSIKSEIASLPILNPRDDLFESLLEEIVNSYVIDNVATAQLLEETQDVDELMLRLPSTRQLEYNHVRAIEEEFHAVGGSIMGFACKKCKGFEFYFDPDRQTSAGDEASHEQLFCKKCNPRYAA
jgi:hypothetical protein